MTEDVAKKLGPGTWDTIHTIASSVETEADEDKFIWTMTIICKKHKCKTCQGHCSTYMKNNPPSAYKGVLNNKGERIGMAKWSWLFHNTVNKRLHKKEVDWDTFYSMYFGDPDTMICTTACGEEKAITNNIEESKPEPRNLRELSQSVSFIKPTTSKIIASAKANSMRIVSRT